MSLTADRDDPRLTHGTDTEPVPQAEAYLILSDFERAKGFVRHVRRSYRHVGSPGPQFELRNLNHGERERYADGAYVKFEPYGPGALAGRFWTQTQLDNIGKGCGTVTTMARPIAETYARDPHFYGATYCCGCLMHLPVGAHGEFTWIGMNGEDTGERVGT